MKYTIEGFSQEYATTLKKKVKVKQKGEEKEKEIKVDCTDLVILRWFVDFFPNMKKMVIDGEEYAWLTHKKMLNDLPLLDISKRACIERMQKLVEFGILKYKLIKEGGTFSLYGFGENYINLVRSNEQGIRSTDIGGIRSTDIGGYVQPDNKDKSIKDTFINNNKVRKKENKTTFDSLINSYTDNEKLRMELKEHLKTRKSKKATMTNRAIELSLNKLDKISSSDEEKIQIVQNAIMSGWTTFYPLKENNYKPINSYQEQKVTINGKEYIMKNGKYYVPRGSGIPVNPYAEDDLPF